MHPFRKFLYVVQRWARIRATLGLSWRPGELRLSPRRKNLMEVAYDLYCIDRWIEISSSEGVHTHADRLAIDASHSSLLSWLQAGEEPLPKPPPKRWSSPDHQMALSGCVEAHEVWHFEDAQVKLAMSGEFVVDQCTEGWALIYTDSPEDHKLATYYEAAHRHYGRWYFWRESKRSSYMGKNGIQYVDRTYWVGVSDYYCAAKALEALLT